MTAPAPGRIRVLQSVQRPNSMTNPYVVQLVEALRAVADVGWFSWSRALFGRYDVLHVHWPEIMMRRATGPARAAAQARFALLMLRCALLRTPLVRTLHNVGVHEDGGRVERLLLRWCVRRTTLWIKLNDATPLPRPGPSAVVPHGHYVDWFARHPVPPAEGHRILNFGLIRPYKGIEAMLAAFEALPDPKARLRVVGRPIAPGLGDPVLAACARDERIGARLEYVDDPELVAELGAAELVVLPYQQMHNSGAVLLALSLARPVLVPDAPVTRALAAEVGEDWVRTFGGELDAAELAAALDWAGRQRAGAPDLGRRDWPAVAAGHLVAYESALKWSGRRADTRP
jgi:beta-1,4-mannosyltransferase